MVELFLSLSTDEKDTFCSEIVELGLINELNEKNLRKTLKTLANRRNGRLKKLYKKLLLTDREMLDRYFHLIATYEEN